MFELWQLVCQGHAVRSLSRLESDLVELAFQAGKEAVKDAIEEYNPDTHKYTVELPDGDEREVKVWWTERAQKGTTLEHNICIALEEHMPKHPVFSTKAFNAAIAEADNLNIHPFEACRIIEAYQKVIDNDNA